MEFTDGVKAFVVFIGGNKKKCKTSMEVYDFLMDNGVSHEISSDAQGWSELATVDESYSQEDFDIYMEDIND